MTTAAVDDRPSETDTTPERPVHLAKCAECAAAVRFRPSTSGASFTLVDADPDATFGIGEHGLPLCPNGHGEMGIADDQLKPVPEAFADASTMLQRASAEAPVQRTLPGVVPAFNFQGCYMELEQQATIVEALRKEYEDDARVAKDSKKAWDDAEDKFTKMALEFRRRRQAKDEEREERAAHPGADASGRLVACIFEQQQAADTCPFCRGDVAETVLTRLGYHSGAIPPADAVAHVDAARAFYVDLEVEETVQALETVRVFVDAGTVEGWTPEDRHAVTEWTDYQAASGSAHAANVPVPERPAILGKPHIPARTPAGERQLCSICEVVLALGTDDQPHYLEADLVGVDCPGKPPAEGHRYPQTGARKASKKKAAKQKGGR